MSQRIRVSRGFFQYRYKKFKISSLLYIPLSLNIGNNSNTGRRSKYFFLESARIFFIVAPNVAPLG